MMLHLTLYPACFFVWNFYVYPKPSKSNIRMVIIFQRTNGCPCRIINPHCNFPGIKNGKTIETTAALILESLRFVIRGKNMTFFKLIHDGNPPMFVFLPSSSGGIAGD